MDTSSNFSAYDVVNSYDIDDLARIFREYGEEKHAYKIAKKIEEQRNIKKIETTLELVDIIDKCYPYKEKRNTHPAKKVFQVYNSSHLMYSLQIHLKRDMINK